jgi:DNA (cytosine-5)-methyltransferase 1
LFYTDDIRVVPAHKLERRCHVRHLTDEGKIEEWVEHDDHFYLNQVGDKHHLSQMKKRDFGYCAECRQDDERYRSERERFLTSNSKLIGMELFSGMGDHFYLSACID